MERADSRWLFFLSPVPAAEHRFDLQLQLLEGIGGERRTDMAAIDLLVGLAEISQPFRRDVGVFSDSEVLLDPIERGFDFFFNVSFQRELHPPSAPTMGY